VDKFKIEGPSRLEGEVRISGAKNAALPAFAAALLTADPVRLSNVPKVADLRTMGNWLQRRYDTPSKYLRSFRYNLNQWGAWNYGGDRLEMGGNVNAHWVFANNWSTGMGINLNARNFDDRATRGGGPGAYYNPNWNYWSYQNTDDRKPVTVSNFLNVGGDHLGTHWAGVSPSVTFRPTSFLSRSQGIDWNHNV